MMKNFFNTYEMECRFIVLMAANVWGVLEEDIFKDYLHGYSHLLKNEFFHLDFQSYATHFVRRLIHKQYLRNLGKHNFDVCYSLTLKGAWYIHRSIATHSLGKLEEDFYVIHEGIREVPYMRDRETYNYQYNEQHFDGRYIQVGL